MLVARQVNVVEYKQSTWVIHVDGVATYHANRVASGMVVVTSEGRLVGTYWTLGHFLTAYGYRRD